MKDVVFTVCSLNYLGKAKVCMASILGDIARVIVVVDEPCSLDCVPDDIAVIFACEFDIPNFYSLAFKYDIVEFNTAVKPYVAEILSRKYDKVIYTDPDTYYFSPISKVLNELNDDSFLLTPHSLSDPFDDARPSYLDFLRFGIFNLGFFAFTSGEKASAILRWWKDRLENDCIYEPAGGFGVDQKIMDLAPVFFDNVSVVRHAGWNVAFWNLHEREIIDKSEVKHFTGSFPLVFAHFSSYQGDGLVAGKQTRFEAGDRADFLDLLSIYKSALEADGGKGFDGYSYDEFFKHKLTLMARRFFREQLRNQYINKNPFKSRELFEQLKSLKLLVPAAKSTVAPNFNQINAFDRKRRILTKFHMLLFRLFGVERYTLLMRYLSVFSLFSNHKDVFHSMDN